MGEMAEYYIGDHGDVSDNALDTELDRQIDAYRSGVSTPPAVVHKLIEYGYGIVDKDGKPYRQYNGDCLWFESAEEAKVIADLVNACYEEDCDCHLESSKPYRVVRLLYQEMDEREVKEAV